MKPEFNLLDELKQNKWPLLGMCLGIFVLTLLLFSGGRKSERVPETDAVPEASLHKDTPVRDGILIDTSEQLFETDSFSLAGPVRFFTRGAGSNLTRFERKEYELDESRLDPRSVPGEDGFRQQNTGRQAHAGSSSPSLGGRK